MPVTCRAPVNHLDTPQGTYSRDPSFHVRGNRSTEKLQDLPKVTRQAVELALNSDALTPEPARTPCLARSPPAAVVTDFF